MVKLNELTVPGQPGETKEPSRGRRISWRLSAALIATVTLGVIGIVTAQVPPLQIIPLAQGFSPWLGHIFDREVRHNHSKIDILSIKKR